MICECKIKRMSPMAGYRDCYKAVAVLRREKTDGRRDGNALVFRMAAEVELACGDSSWKVIVETGLISTITIMSDDGTEKEAEQALEVLECVEMAFFSRLESDDE